jgi:hypothetical protein
LSPVVLATLMLAAGFAQAQDNPQRRLTRGG